MTYTTEEKRMIAGKRHESKMDMLDEIAVAEGVYKEATVAHKATLDKTIAEIETIAKDSLKIEILEGLAEIRNETGDDSDE